MRLKKFIKENEKFKKKIRISQRWKYVTGLEERRPRLNDMENKFGYFLRKNKRNNINNSKRYEGRYRESREA